MTNRAIVVGIKDYPELKPDLQGPEHDAERFFQWVTTAGGVDPNPQLGHAKLIVSSKPAPARALDATPTYEAISREFEALEEEALAAPNGKAGDRLYLYLSGHGFGKDLDSAALLMANATQLRTRNNLAGRAWADHFYVSGFFDEVILFMDCCRERYSAALPHGPGPATQRPPVNGRRFYGFASKHGRLAVERPIDGTVGGVFTATLLDALNGDAAEETGRVTAESLQAYLYSNMKELLTQDDRDDSDVAQEPDIFCDPPAAVKEFVIVNVQQKTHAVQIGLQGIAIGTPLKLREGGSLAVVKAGISDASGEWRVDLPVGRYLFSANGTEKLVTVKGRGVVEVADV